jgi:hypothetical protein
MSYNASAVNFTTPQEWHSALGKQTHFLKKLKKTLWPTTTLAL